MRKLEMYHYNYKVFRTLLRKPQIVICTAYPLHVRIFTFLPDLAQMLLNPTFVSLRFILFKKLKKNKSNFWEWELPPMFWHTVDLCQKLLSLENPFEFIWNCKSGRNLSWLKWKWSGAMCVYLRTVLAVFNPITW